MTKGGRREDRPFSAQKSQVTNLGKIGVVESGILHMKGYLQRAHTRERSPLTTRALKRPNKIDLMNKMRAHTVRRPHYTTRTLIFAPLPLTGLLLGPRMIDSCINEVLIGEFSGEEGRLSDALESESPYKALIELESPMR